MNRIDTARSLGVFSLGLAAGLTVAVPLLVAPSIQGLGLTPRQKAVSFNAEFKNGVVALPALTGVASLVSFYTAYVVSQAPLTVVYFVGGKRICNRSTLLYLISALSAAFLPYTFTVMNTTVSALFKANDQREDLKASQVDGHLENFFYLHTGRIAIVTTAFALSVVELVSI